ncbi:fimbrial protein [Pantoea dispersa]|uniref:fimbrial protein n=1 Tax=Pantoea dispersa TaxID=59814 RepID=UPI0039B476AC
MDMIKKALLASMVLGGTLSPAVAVTGTMSFNTSVAASSCTVPTDQLTREITLAEITSGEINNASEGDRIKSENLTFDFMTCPPTTANVGIQFDFNSDPTNTSHMANSGSAEGVLLGITNINDQLQTSGSIVQSTDFDPNTGTGTVNAKVSAYKVGSAPPVPGTIESTATITIVAQ